jgi:hypothetical protein
MTSADGRIHRLTWGRSIYEPFIQRVWIDGDLRARRYRCGPEEPPGAALLERTLPTTPAALDTVLPQERLCPLLARLQRPDTLHQLGVLRL